MLELVISIGWLMCPKQDATAVHSTAKATRTAGSNADFPRNAAATLVALLIEFRLKFYKLVTINRAAQHHNL